MKNSNKKAEPVATVVAPIFVAKRAEPLALDLQQALTAYADVLRSLAPFKQQQENLKSVIRELLKGEPNEKFCSAEGIVAQVITSSKSKINKALAMKICGAQWSKVESFSESESMRINVPGVKGD